MEALKILKAYARCREEERILMYPLKEVKKAIAELEALQNRNCSNCKFEDYQVHLKPIQICGKDKSFYCNKWESK